MDKPQVTAARVRQTARDAEALEWLAQMYGAPLDIVAKLCDATERRTYAIVKRWATAGWVETGRVDAGPMWVWPKRQTAAAYLDWDPGAWAPRPSQAAHLRACAITRMALAAGDGAAWYSERRLRHEAPKKTRGQQEPYLPDGMWLAEDGRWRAIEVELTSKGTTRTREVISRASAAVGGKDDMAAGVIYVCGTAAIAAAVTDAVASWGGRFEGPKGNEIARRFEVRMLAELSQAVGLLPTTGIKRS